MSNPTEADLLKMNLVPDGNGGYRPRNEGSGMRKAIAPKKIPAKGRFSNVKKDNSGMNKTESQYSRHLDALKSAKQIHDWWFEKITLKIAPDTRLTVDFMVQRIDGGLELHDAKGSRHIYQDDAKVKMKVAANMFPFDFYVVFPRTQKMGGGDWDIEKVKTDNE